MTNLTLYTRTDGKKFASYKEDATRIYLKSKDGEKEVMDKSKVYFIDRTIHTVGDSK